MRTVRVLLLDIAEHHEDAIRELLLSDIAIEFVADPDLALRNHYQEPSAAETAAIRRLTESAAVDVVLIGNNLGSGVPCAAAVAPALRERTIIMWGDRPHRNEAPYEALRYCHFIFRAELGAFLRDLLRGMS